MTVYDIRLISVQIQRHPDMDIPDVYIYNDEVVRIKLRDKVRSLSIDPTGVKFAVGSPGIIDVPLHIIDIESYVYCN